MYLWYLLVNKMFYTEEIDNWVFSPSVYSVPCSSMKLFTNSNQIYSCKFQKTNINGLDPGPRPL